MLKFVMVNPIATMLAAMFAAIVVMVEAVSVQVRPTFQAVRGLFSLPPPNSANRYLAGVQRGVSMTGFVIGIAVAALVVAIIIPVAFGQFFATVTTSWDAQTILIWGIVPVVVILAIVLFFLNKADDQT